MLVDGNCAVGVRVIWIFAPMAQLTESGLVVSDEMGEVTTLFVCKAKLRRLFFFFCLVWQMRCVLLLYVQKALILRILLTKIAQTQDVKANSKTFLTKNLSFKECSSLYLYNNGTRLFV